MENKYESYTHVHDVDFARVSGALDIKWLASRERGGVCKLNCMHAH